MKTPFSESVALFHVIILKFLFTFIFVKLLKNEEAGISEIGFRFTFEKS